MKVLWTEVFRGSNEVRKTFYYTHYSYADSNGITFHGWWSYEIVPLLQRELP